MSRPLPGLVWRSLLDGSTRWRGYCAGHALFEVEQVYAPGVPHRYRVVWADFQRVPPEMLPVGNYDLLDDAQHACFIAYLQAHLGDLP